MKKLYSIVVLVFGLMAWNESNAQELGLRFGDVIGGNVAIDGVFSVGQFSRVHADLSFGNGVGIEALYNFIYRPIGGEAFNWYVGVGPSLRVGQSPFILGASGEIGLEYKFNEVPIALGLDWRPTLVLVENTDFRFRGFGLNIRYVF